MTILLTGGAGKTSIRIARLLQEAQIPFLIASRKGEAGVPSGMQATKFDWLDESTFENPFKHELHTKEKISAIYLVAPNVTEPGVPMNAFIDLARTHGVNRFVLIASSSITQDAPFFVGSVWKHLLAIGVDWCVLRPTWFMENFSEWQHLASIRDEGKIYTAAADGIVPFISAEDIAALGFRGLTDEKSHNTDYLLLGSESLTHDQVAAKFSSGLGRKVTHVKQSREERVQWLKQYGQPEELAQFLAKIEVDTAGGSEDQKSDTVERMTGRPPKTFETFIQENRALWQ